MAEPKFAPSPRIFYNKLQLNLSRIMLGERILIVDDESHIVELASRAQAGEASRRQAVRHVGRYQYWLPNSRVVVLTPPLWLQLVNAAST